LQKSGNREQGTVGRIRVFGHKINLILIYARGLLLGKIADVYFGIVSDRLFLPHFVPELDAHHEKKISDREASLIQAD
jgi:uncharacterized membrane protein (DUF2068 family)